MALAGVEPQQGKVEKTQGARRHNLLKLAVAGSFNESVHDHLEIIVAVRLQRPSGKCRPQTPENAEKPPSTGTTIPVTKADAGDRSHSTAPSRSSGWPNRPIGVWPIIDVPRAVSSPVTWS